MWAAEGFTKSKQLRARSMPAIRLAQCSRSVYLRLSKLPWLKRRDMMGRKERGSRCSLPRRVYDDSTSGWALTSHT